MPANGVSNYLKYINLQMAAEAIFPHGFTYGPIPRQTLTEGNGRSSRFTNVLADQLLADGWKQRRGRGRRPWAILTLSQGGLAADAILAPTPLRLDGG